MCRLFKKKGDAKSSMPIKSNKTNEITTNPKIKSVAVSKPDVEVIFENHCESHNPIYNGSKILHEVKENYQATGIQKYFDVEAIEFGKTATGSITFIAPEHHMNCFKIGSRFPFKENGKILGYATITKIFNKHLENKPTYLRYVDDLTDSLFYEFQRGKYKMGPFKWGEQKKVDSIYLRHYGDDSIHDYSAMEVFSYLIDGFHEHGLFGVTYLSESSAKLFISRLIEFSEILISVNDISLVLMKMNMLNAEELDKNDLGYVKMLAGDTITGVSTLQNRFSELNPLMLANTAKDLAYWIDKSLEMYDIISILGI